MASTTPIPKPRILLVEDEPIVALSERRLLERNGYAVVVAHRGEEAIEAAAHDEIDLVLMDIGLGDGIDGTVVASRILASRPLPIVFLTGHAEREAVELASGVRHYGYLVKGCGEFVLLEAVETARALFASAAAAHLDADRYRSMIGLTGEIVVQHDLDGRWTFVNDRACEFWGASREELSTGSFHDYLHPDDIGTTDAVIDAMFREGAPIRGHVNRQRTPLGWRTVEWNSDFIRDAAGRPTGFQVTGRDITARTQAERSLRSHRDLLEQVMSTTPTGIICLHRDGGIVQINRRAGEILGVRPEEAEGLNYAAPPWRLEDDAGHPLAVDAMPFSIVRDTRRPLFGAEHMLRRPDGEVRRISVNSAPLTDAQGGFDGTVAVLEDITDRVRAERELAHREARFRGLFEQVPAGIIIADEQSRVVDANPQACEILGYTRDELVGMSAADVADPEEFDPDRIADELRRARENDGFVESDGTYIRKDGAAVDVVTRVRILRGTPGPELHLVTFNDVTERRRSEVRIVSLLEQTELLNREIHHRVKNDLNLVQSLASLQKDASDNPETRHALEEMINRLSVIGRVYDELRGAPDMTTVRLEDVLGPLVDGLRRSTLPAGIATTVSVDAPAVTQPLSVAIGIIANELVTNAAKHGLAEAAAGTIRVEVASGDGALVVTVIDSGRGFPPEFLREPRLGYGLTIVDALARQHAGTVRYSNEGGAAVRVGLPMDNSSRAHRG